jgi:DNA polymerase III epsilon subunit-like protein
LPTIRNDDVIKNTTKTATPNTRQNVFKMTTREIKPSVFNLEKAPHIVFDLETTGFSREPSLIIKIAVEFVPKLKIVSISHLLNQHHQYHGTWNLIQ